MDLDAFASAGLYDPALPTARDRAELIEHLVDRFGHDAVLEAAARVPMFTVAVELSDPPPPRRSAREVADAAGADLEDVLLIRAASGFPVGDPEAPEIPDVQVADIAVARAAIELFGRERTLAFTRVVGGAVVQISEAARALFASAMAEGSGDDGPTELEISVQNEVAWASWQSLPSVVEHLLLERADVSQDLVTEILAGSLRRAIGFVDLVGSTAWTATVEPAHHAAALARFEQAAWEIATRRGGRLVKLIGDEAMFVTESSTVACEIAADLVQVAASDPDLPAARAGVVVGEVVARAGDYYGETVNLAARLVTVAEPGHVVASKPVVDQLDPSWPVEPLGPVEVRGFSEPVDLYEVRRG